VGLLLTGASGLVGGELLDRLLAARPDRRIFLLTRGRDRISPHHLRPNVSVVEGDLRSPGLGWNGVETAEVRASLTEIVHCAADTRFDLALEEARASNVAGTAQLLDLARQCPRLQRFIHVSSVYAAGRMAGLISEAPLAAPSVFSSSYQQTKFEAEQLVVGAMHQLPVAIVRLSSIIGDSATGRVRQFNHVHQLMKLFPRNHLLPMVPAEPDVPIDLIPTDWTAAALAWVVDQGFAPGRVFHLCAGPQDSFTVRDMIDLTRQVFESHPKASRWMPIRVPRLVSLAEWEQFAAHSIRGGHKLLNELIRVLGFFLPHLAIHQCFENRRTQRDLTAAGIAPAPARETYARVLRYCLDTDWGRV